MNSPKLRFKEFTDEWQEKKLAECSVINPSTGKLPDDFYYIDLDSVSDGNLNKFNKIKSQNAPSRAQRKLQIDDILYQTVRPYQKNNLFFNFNDDNYIASTGYAQIRFHGVAKFIYQYLHTNLFVNKVLIRCTGTSYPAINSSDLGKIHISIPGKEEQDKIAGFLTVVDEKINKLEEKEKGFEKYKKGVMQAIFSQKVRFKKSNESNYPDWEEKKLGEIGNFKTSSIDKLVKPNQQKVQLINYMNVYRHESINSSNRDNLSETSVSQTQLTENNLLIGDILFTPSSETPSDIGHSVVIKEDLPETVYSYHLLRFRPKVDLDLNFSHYFCNIPQVLKQMSTRSQGSTRFTITVGEFSKVKVNIPKSAEEQEKIAEFLTSLDNKVDLISKELEQAKLFKKSLLQQMFV